MRQLREFWDKATAPRYHNRWLRVLHQIGWWLNLINIPLNVLTGSFGWAFISLMWVVVFTVFIQQSKNWDKMSKSDNWPDLTKFRL